MENIHNRPYYRATRRMLQCMGQWPYQSSMKNKYLRCLTIGLIASIVVPHIIKLVESFDDMDIVMEVLPMLGLHALALIKFFNWVINEHYMRRLLSAIERDWKTLKLPQDIELLHQHSERGRQFSAVYAKCLYGILLLYFGSPAVPKILDYIQPLNNTRPRIYLYQTEYFIDQEKYYVYLLVHAYMTVPVSLASIVFFDNLFAAFTNHACGMFNILNHHLQTLHMKVDLGNEEKSLKKSDVIRERIKICADLQSNAIKFVQDLESSYSIALLFLVGLNMVSITLTGMVALIKINHPNEVVRALAVNFGTFFHLFWSSWQGHILIVQSDKVFTAAYQNEWYSMPRKLQRMLIPIMMRSTKPYQITAGKLYVMSMQSFGAALKTTGSLFTFLLSTQ